MEERKSFGNNLMTVFLVLILILLDQIIKLYIKFNLMGSEFDVYGSILGFRPIINEDYSWINSLGQLGIGLFTHIIVNVVILLLFIIIYDFISTKNMMFKIVQAVFCFIFAGVLCSLIDKIAWGGSLDYIWIKGFFICDLKDIYLTIFEIITISMLLFNYKGIRSIKERLIFKEFRSYMKLRFQKN